MVGEECSIGNRECRVPLWSITKPQLQIALMQAMNFALNATDRVRLLEMNPSPFHGIFGAFDQEHSLQGVVPASSTVHVQEHESPAPHPQRGQIAVDIFEQDNYYIIRAPIAGVKLSDLDIEVDDKVLTIRGTRALSDEIPDHQYYVKECYWGEFSRSVTLPCSIDPKRVKATFSKDSILKILIPKEEKVKIVRINEG